MVTEKLTNQELQTQKALLELAELKQQQHQDNCRAKEADSPMSNSLKQISSKQGQLLETQNEQGQAIEGLQESLV